MDLWGNLIVHILTEFPLAKRCKLCMRWRRCDWSSILLCLACSVSKVDAKYKCKPYRSKDVHRRTILLVETSYSSILGWIWTSQCCLETKSQESYWVQIFGSLTFSWEIFLLRWLQKFDLIKPSQSQHWLLILHKHLIHFVADKFSIHFRPIVWVQCVGVTSRCQQRYRLALHQL